MPSINFLKAILPVALLFFVLPAVAQLQFIENKGQWDKRVDYKSGISNGAFFLQQQGFTVLLQNEKDLQALSANMHGHVHDEKGTDKKYTAPPSSSGTVTLHQHAYRVRFVGASSLAKAVPDKPVDTYNNYFIGSDKSKWQGGCKIFQAVTYRDMYPNIDVRYYTDQGTLKYDIIVAKPAFDIKEGIFYDKIDGYVIKLGSKEKNDSIIHNVVIFEKKNGLQDNMLMAETGVMRITKDKRFLEFVLKNGWRYEEKGARNTTNTEFTRMGFKEYKKMFDLKSFQMNKSGDSAFYDPKMLSLRQLNSAIDSLHNTDSFYTKKSDREVSPFLRFSHFIDTGWAKIDTCELVKVNRFEYLIADSIKQAVTDAAMSQVLSIKGNISVLATDYQEKAKSLRLHEIEWHRKLTLSAACLVLFLIGAPLGSIIRRGGLGTPLVFAIIFFVVFHLFNTFGEKFVKSDQASPLFGMWLSTLILIPIGAFLIYKAMRDSQLFNQEFYYRSFKQLRSFLANFSFTKNAVLKAPWFPESPPKNPLNNPPSEMYF